MYAHDSVDLDAGDVVGSVVPNAEPREQQVVTRLKPERDAQKQTLAERQVDSECTTLYTRNELIPIHQLIIKKKNIKQS